jgi:hypothetical protein
MPGAGFGRDEGCTTGSVVLEDLVGEDETYQEEEEEEDVLSQDGIEPLLQIPTPVCGWGPPVHVAEGGGWRKSEEEEEEEVKRVG